MNFRFNCSSPSFLAVQLLSVYRKEVSQPFTAAVRPSFTKQDQTIQRPTSDERTTNGISASIHFYTHSIAHYTLLCAISAALKHTSLPSETRKAWSCRVKFFFFLSFSVWRFCFATTCDLRLATATVLRKGYTPPATYNNRITVSHSRRQPTYSLCGLFLLLFVKSIFLISVFHIAAWDSGVTYTSAERDLRKVPSIDRIFALPFFSQRETTAAVLPFTRPKQSYFTFRDSGSLQRTGYIPWYLPDGNTAPTTNRRQGRHLLVLPIYPSIPVRLTVQKKVPSNSYHPSTAYLLSPHQHLDLPLFTTPQTLDQEGPSSTPPGFELLPIVSAHGT